MSDALLANLVPFGRQHISLTGDNLWGVNAGVGPDGSSYFADPSPTISGC